MPTLRPGPLQWAMSCFCVIIGTLMLITPHQFASRTFTPLQPALPLWGAGFLLAGCLLLAVAVLEPRRGLVVLAHLAAGAVILSLAYAFTLNSAWTGTTNYLVLGLGTLLAPLLARRASRRAAPRDLFAILMAAAGVLTGLVMLAIPGQFRAPAYDAVRPFLPLHGMAFLLGGLVLLAVAVRRPDDANALRAAHLLAGGAYLAFCLFFAIPNRGLPAITLYGGLGGLLALLPWVTQRLQRIDPASLQTRLALALAALATVPLVLGTALATSVEERSATELALSRQQTLATALAGNVSTYVELHREAVEVLAAELAAYPGTPVEQVALLKRFREAYGDVSAFVSFDADGNPVARSDDRGLGPSARELPLFAQAKQTLRPTLDVRIARVLKVPVVSMGAPVLDADGRFVALVAAAIDTARLAEMASAASQASAGEVYLVDGNGRVIAHPDRALAAEFVDRSAADPVAALRERGAPGDLMYLAPDGQRLVGFAPVADLGWGVIVDLPAATVLSGVRAARDTTLVLTFVVLGAAIWLSLRLAGALSVPLALLADATRQLAQGRREAPLPRSRIREVATLADTLGRLRDSLAARTLERDRAERRLRLLADTGSALAASLDSGATLERLSRLLTPALADWVGVYLADGAGRPALAVAAHADPAHQPLVPGEGDPFELRRALRDGSSRLIVPPVSPEQRRLLRWLGCTSAMIVPLRARDQTLGLVVLASADDYTVEDLALGEELGRRAALALDNARLYATEQQARAEAEAAVHIREQFLSIAAHELKTPLTPLLGQAQLIARRAERDGRLDERDRRAVQVIEGQARRLNQLVSSMLDVNRLQTGQLHLQRAPLDLRDLLRRLADEQRPLLEAHTIELALPDRPATVDGDRLRLEQVVQNLVQNAIKYSPAGGVVGLRLACEAGEVVLEVCDEGIGIPADALPRLFEPFFRAPNAERSVMSGLGVGLAVVREIVQLHAGSVEVVSTEGQGSCFTVRLPSALAVGEVAEGRKGDEGNRSLRSIGEGR